MMQIISLLHSVAFILISNSNVIRTLESRFLEPPGETQIGSRNRRVREIGGKITVFDLGEETTFGSSYREVREIGIPLYY